MLNVKKTLTKILTCGIFGVTTKHTSISVTNDTVFTCSKTGWLVCTLTTNSGQTVAPYVALDVFDSGETFVGSISTAWGVTSNGAYLSVQAPVQSGQKYRIHASRCSISATKIYY